jgi:hypothetical protein
VQLICLGWSGKRSPPSRCCRAEQCPRLPEFTCLIEVLVSFVCILSFPSDCQLSIHTRLNTQCPAAGAGRAFGATGLRPQKLRLQRTEMNDASERATTPWWNQSRSAHPLAGHSLSINCRQIRSSPSFPRYRLRSAAIASNLSLGQFTMIRSNSGGAVVPEIRRPVRLTFSVLASSREIKRMLSSKYSILTFSACFSRLGRLRSWPPQLLGRKTDQGLSRNPAGGCSPMNSTPIARTPCLGGSTLRTKV